MASVPDGASSWYMPVSPRELRDHSETATLESEEEL